MGETVIVVLFVPTGVPPQETVYQLIVAPLPPTPVSVVELPEHILGFGLVIDVGATGG